MDVDRQADLDRWLAPFVAALKHKTRARCARPISPGWWRRAAEVGTGMNGEIHSVTARCLRVGHLASQFEPSREGQLARQPELYLLGETRILAFLGRRDRVLQLGSPI